MTRDAVASAVAAPVGQAAQAVLHPHARPGQLLLEAALGATGRLLQRRRARCRIMRSSLFSRHPSIAHLDSCDSGDDDLGRGAPVLQRVRRARHPVLPRLAKEQVVVLLLAVAPAPGARGVAGHREETAAALL